MKKEGRDLVAEAVNDTKALKEAALQAAKNELLESMAPAIKNLLEKNIKEALTERKGMYGNLSQTAGEDYLTDKERKFQEAKGDSEMDKGNAGDNEDLNLESLAGFFTEEADEGEEGEEGKEKKEDEVEESSIPMLGEAEEEMEEGKKKEGEDDMAANEEIEISESELRKVYEAALATEVAVKKGFGEMTPMGELEDVAKDVSKGINPVSKSEKMWGEKPEGDLEHKQDFVVKEMIQKGLAENRALRSNLKKAVAMIQTLGSRLHEVNLFNAKVLHVNRILSKNPRLTSEQKKVVLESLDRAKSIDEVRTVYDVINNSFAAAGQLSESARKPAANAQRARSSGAANQKVLSESVDRSNDTMTRLQKLAGLVK